MKLPPGYVPGLLQQHKATAKGGFGERLMKQFGWSEGKGLGAKEDGMAEAIKVKQKKDQTGVGDLLHIFSDACQALMRSTRRALPYCGPFSLSRQISFFDAMPISHAFG
jgi:hypothetical protein